MDLSIEGHFEPHRGPFRHHQRMDQLLRICPVFHDGLGCSNALFLDGGEALGSTRRSSAATTRPAMEAMGQLSQAKWARISLHKGHIASEFPSFYELAGTTVRLRGLSETSKGGGGEYQIGRCITRATP